MSESNNENRKEMLILVNFLVFL
jgi:hypothetical protein